MYYDHVTELQPDVAHLMQLRNIDPLEEVA